MNTSKKRKVAIIQPSFYFHRTGKLIKKKSKICLAPSLIGSYLASFFPEKEFAVELFDEVIHELNPNNHYDFVLITFSTGQALRAYEVASVFKKCGSTIIMGGYHVTALPDEALHYADTIVLGEFEPIASTFMEDLCNNRLKPVYCSETFFDMSTMNFPRYELVNLKKYATPLFTKFPIETSRGCPNDCDFCCIHTIHGRKMRFRPVEEVMEHVDRIKADFASWKPRLFFIDENMVSYTERNIRLLEALIPRKITWSAFCSVDICKHPDFIRLAARAGCVGAVIGIETTSEKNLKRVNKTHNKIEYYHETARLFRQNNIPIYASMMAGFPDDDVTILTNTITMLKQLKIPFSFFYPVFPFPGTKMYEALKQENLLSDISFWLKVHNIYDLVTVSNFSDNKLVFYDEFRKMVRQHYSFNNILNRSMASNRFWRVLIENIGLKLLYEKYDSYATI
jgi:radical SAM superfamily enzyme YgiQ (UPF0313 family)